MRASTQWEKWARERERGRGRQCLYVRPRVCVHMDGSVHVFVCVHVVCAHVYTCGAQYVYMYVHACAHVWQGQEGSG